MSEKFEVSQSITGPTGEVIQTSRRSGYSPEELKAMELADSHSAGWGLAPQPGGMFKRLLTTTPMPPEEVKP
jgi:hypothetical protein